MTKKICIVGSNQTSLADDVAALFVGASPPRSFTEHARQIHVLPFVLFLCCFLAKAPAGNVLLHFMQTIIFCDSASFSAVAVAVAPAAAAVPSPAYKMIFS